ncbi:MAG: hypothetical protein OQL08_02145, partial [Gammaproteobacteria bacterium]|nr:hypothetical protein [Gammaproteobacteria bacterium]
MKQRTMPDRSNRAPSLNRRHLVAVIATLLLASPAVQAGNVCDANGSGGAGGSTATNTGSWACGEWNNATADDSSAVGHNNSATADDSSAYGRVNSASGSQSSAMGYSNSASGTYSSAVGYDNSASNTY